MPTNVQYPVIITYTRFFARFSTYHNLFYPCTEFSLEVYSGQQRFTDNDFMLYRSCFIKRKTVIHSVLIFHGATNGNIIIPVPPIRRQTLAEPVYAFSYKQEMKIVSFPHHFPCFYTPFIGFFYQKIGGKTSWLLWNCLSHVYYLRDIHNNAGNLYLAYGSHAKDSIEKTPDLFYFPFCLNKIYHCLQS